jgi:hypothetical protein
MTPSDEQFLTIDAELTNVHGGQAADDGFSQCLKMPNDKDGQQVHFCGRDFVYGPRPHTRPACSEPVELARSRRHAASVARNDRHQQMQSHITYLPRGPTSYLIGIGRPLYGPITTCSVADCRHMPRGALTPVMQGLTIPTSSCVRLHHLDAAISDKPPPR